MVACNYVVTGIIQCHTYMLNQTQNQETTFFYMYSWMLAIVVWGFWAFTAIINIFVSKYIFTCSLKMLFVSDTMYAIDISIINMHVEVTVESLESPT